MASNDIYELRDQIKRMNAHLQSLEDERITLRKEERTYEDRLTALRMETSVLAALDEVRFEESKDDSVEFTDSQVLHDRKFLEANLKLELSVFNAEIRQALPRLEKEALQWEESLSQHTKALEHEEARQKQLPMRSTEVIDEMTIKLQDERRRGQEQLERIRKEESAKRKALERELNEKRTKLVGLEDDVEFEKDRAFRLKKVLLAEQAQLTFLLSEYKGLRDKLKVFHSGRGWEMEAFLSAAGSQRSSISIDNAVYLLLNWVYPIRSCGGGDDGQPGEIVRAAAKKVLGTDSSDASMNCQEFLELCDVIITKHSDST